MDTKGHELAFVAERLRAAGVAVVTVDVGTKGPPGRSRRRRPVDGRRLSSYRRRHAPQRFLNPTAARRSPR